jgi:hypothetical protein
VSKLEFYSRPLVAFDPANKDHRRYFHDFRRTNTWGRCPVRFILPGESGSDLVKMITRELVDWYVYKEFERSVAKKQQKKVSQKAKKTVDKSSK